jgi:hypothetical protein
MNPEVGDDNSASSTTMSLDGELKITETMGASFLNRLTDIADELDSDPVGLVFVLKTFFVGRNVNGLTEMITTVRPMMFVAFDISAIFDSSGAKYKLEFVGLTNGAGKLPQPQKIFEGISITLDKDSLEETFKNVSRTVNEKYKRQKGKIIADFAKTLEAERTVAENSTGSTLGEAVNFVDANYRDVEYSFILDEEYKSSRYATGGVQKERTKSRNNKSQITFGANVTVEHIIKEIMTSSPGILDDEKGIGTDINKATNKPLTYLFKIISVIRSTPTKYVVEYHIKRFLKAEDAYSQQEKNGEIVPLEGQSIEFDYIFTGKNVDIKNFDIKMEMGMAFFQLAATTDNVPDQKRNISKTAYVGGQSSVGNAGKKTRKATPLFLGTTISKPSMRNTRRPIDSAGFQAALDRHASLENISASMTIYGNPQLLDEMSILPSEIVEGVTQTEIPVKDRTINPRWMSTPTLIKINIKMPIDVNDVNTEYEAFWYTGWYNLQVVENIFSSDGEFTQELGMYSIPQTDEVQKVTDIKEDTNPVKEKPAGEEENSQIAILQAELDAIEDQRETVGVFDGARETAIKKQLKELRTERKKARTKANQTWLDLWLDTDNSSPEVSHEIAIETPVDGA